MFGLANRRRIIGRLHRWKVQIAILAAQFEAMSPQCREVSTTRNKTDALTRPAKRAP
jgi:hypothetical protein